MRYSTLVNGYSVLNLTKLDVLTGKRDRQEKRREEKSQGTGDRGERET